MDEVESLQAELEHYRAQKQRIRDIIGRVGGQSTRRQDTLINAVFVGLVAVLFLLDILRHILGRNLRLLPPSLVLEIAVLLVSVKIIWMIYRQAKVEHFQFWILNSIEYQLNTISRRIGDLERLLQDGQPDKSELTEVGGAVRDFPQKRQVSQQEKPTIQGADFS